MNSTRMKPPCCGCGVNPLAAASDDGERGLAGIGDPHVVLHLEIVVDPLYRYLLLTAEKKFWRRLRQS
jgi:hypothetical protein